MSKLRAAGLHSLISLGVVVSVLLVMYLLWYPNKYFALMGGQTLIVTLACVDIFLGPLLTFVVFKSGKKSLKFDLICIGLMQIAALSYGVYVMFQARPVFNVFNKTKFQIAAVVDIGEGEIAQGRQPKWQRFSLTGPEIVAIYTPDKKNIKEYVFAMTESDMAYRYPRLFDDYNLHRHEVIAAGKPLKNLYASRSVNKAAVTAFVRRANRPEADFLYLPISSEVATMSAVVDAKTGEFLEIIDATE